ncbi:hypothetical protein Bbelb_030470 [Branchiostoma belcheri]|nr:hypothetical protein Bbelb_030470 [Branchiostoma belcheri]
MRPDAVPLGKALHTYPPPSQIEGQVSNGTCLQLADESSARRAGVIKADLERKLPASIPTRTSLSPSIWCRWRRRSSVWSQICNLLSTLNKSTQRPLCQL